jgi:hypothetical protein
VGLVKWFSHGAESESESEEGEWEGRAFGETLGDGLAELTVIGPETG